MQDSTYISLEKFLFKLYAQDFNLYTSKWSGKAVEWVNQVYVNGIYKELQNIKRTIQQGAAVFWMRGNTESFLEISQINVLHSIYT